MNCSNCGKYIDQTTYAWLLLWMWIPFGIIISGLIIFSTNKDMLNGHFSICNLEANLKKTKKEIPVKINVNVENKTKNPIPKTHFSDDDFSKYNGNSENKKHKEYIKARNYNFLEQK